MSTACIVFSMTNTDTTAIRYIDYVTGVVSYDIRRSEGGALIHLGTARRSGKAWVVASRTGEATSTRTLTAARAHLAETVSVLA